MKNNVLNLDTQLHVFSFSNIIKPSQNTKQISNKAIKKPARQKITKPHFTKISDASSYYDICVIVTLHQEIFLCNR